MAKFCTKCGNPLQENDKFCRKCGAKVIINTPEPQGQGNVINRTAIGTSYGMPGNGYNNPEGTVLLGDMNNMFEKDPAIKKADLHLSLTELLNGCSKVIDFGTGKKYELSIPPGLSPKDIIEVEAASLVDSEAGVPCKIELTIIAG